LQNCTSHMQSSAPCAPSVTYAYSAPFRAPISLPVFKSWHPLSQPMLVYISVYLQSQETESLPSLKAARHRTDTEPDLKRQRQNVKMSKSISQN
jgi:hypothetical protein